MRHRMLCLVGLLFALNLGLVGGHPARAAMPEGPRTDFTRVTPANAVLYATIQSSSAAQSRNLGRLLASPALRNLAGTLLGAIGGVAGTATSGGQSGGAQTGGSPDQITGLLTSALGGIFSGELGLALLPPTLETGQGSGASPRLHLLLDAGLRPGANPAALLAGAAGFGLPTTSQPDYKGFSVVSLDLNALARLIGRASNTQQLASGTLIDGTAPISSVFYATVAGNDAVLASDLPTLAAAIDVYTHAVPSLGASDNFLNTAGLLPTERFATLYLHLGSDTLGTVTGSLGGAALGTLVQLIPLGPDAVGLQLATALTALPGRLLLTTSTGQGVSSRSIGL